MNPELDATQVVKALNKRGVVYVVIGAFAAIAQGAPIPPTRDVDFTPQANRANLDRLSDALRDLKARIRTDAVPDGLPFDHDGESLRRAEIWNLTCQFGEFDICLRPAGFDNGYDGLSEHAHLVRVGDIEVYVADLSDVIKSKEAAGRPKDLRVLPTLYLHREGSS